jgi:Uma2 family endonuclease
MRPDALETSQPVAFFEVLSPSTRKATIVHKADEYRALPGVKYFIFLESDQVAATVWSRTDAGWTDQDFIGLEAEFALPDLGIVLPMAEIYEGVG